MKWLHMQSMYVTVTFLYFLFNPLEYANEYSQVGQFSGAGNPAGTKNDEICQVHIRITGNESRKIRNSNYDNGDKQKMQDLQSHNRQ